MYSLRFKIHDLPKMMNGYLGKAHWTTFKREKDKWLAYVSAATLGKRPDKPLKKAKVTIIRASSVEPDFDGLVSGGKRLLDALVKLDILEDDRMSNIGRPDYQWERAAPKQGFVEVLVEEEELCPAKEPDPKSP